MRNKPCGTILVYPTVEVYEEAGALAYYDEDWYPVHHRLRGWVAGASDDVWAYTAVRETKEEAEAEMLEALENPNYVLTADGWGQKRLYGGLPINGSRGRGSGHAGS